MEETKPENLTATPEPKEASAAKAPDASSSESKGGWIQKALGDWLHLLQGPTAPRFKHGVETNDWHRLFRLLVTSLFLAGIALGTSYIQPELTPNFNALIMTSKPAMLLIIGSAAFAVLYQIFAWAFRIAVTLPKSFFAILFLGLPWLPLMALAESFQFRPNAPLSGLIFGFGAQFFALAAVVNFGRGVRHISNSASWKVWLSLAIPLVLVVYLILQ